MTAEGSNWGENNKVKHLELMLDIPPKIFLSLNEVTHDIVENTMVTIERRKCRPNRHLPISDDQMIIPKSKPSSG